MSKRYMSKVVFLVAGHLRFEEDGDVVFDGNLGNCLFESWEAAK